MPSLLGFAPLTQVEIGGENLEPHRHHVLRAEEANLEQSAHKHHKCHLVACPVVDAGPIPEGIRQGPIGSHRNPVSSRHSICVLFGIPLECHRTPKIGSL